jgi:hypothetical protein
MGFKINGRPTWKIDKMVYEEVSLDHTLPLAGSKSIIMEPGQWFAFKQVTPIPAILICYTPNSSSRI